jgi:nucleotide-binding universal stress UspA family protein
MIDTLLRRVLVPLDGSPQSEKILPPLRRFLSPEDSSLTFLEILPFLHPGAREDADRYLWRMAFPWKTDGFASDHVVRFGSPAERILEEAEERKSTLIALATHGRSGMERLILGSVAETILQNSPVPVLLTRSFSSAEVPPKRPIRTILVPLDGTPEALEALDPVLSLARHRDARVHLLRVGEPSAYEGHWDDPDETTRKADQILRDACLPTDFEFRRGQPAEEILRSAGENDADLLVLSTHARSGPSRWLKGSVTADVLRKTTIPLLVMRRQSTFAKPASAEQDVAQNPAAPADISLSVLPPA